MSDCTYRIPRDPATAATYNVIRSDGSPVVSLLGERAASADWPTGMMVSFAVRPADIGEFHAKTQQIFRWFRIKPNILGGSPVRPPRPSTTAGFFSRPNANWPSAAVPKPRCKC